MVLVKYTISREEENHRLASAKKQDEENNSFIFHFKSRNIRRSTKATTRLSTVEEESVYTSTTLGQSQKRMDNILRANANFTVQSSPRTETGTLSEIDTAVDTGLGQRKCLTAGEQETGHESEIDKNGAKIAEKEDCKSTDENEAGGGMGAELGHSAAMEDINGNAMKEDIVLETDKLENLEAGGKKSENGNVVEDSKKENSETVDYHKEKLEMSEQTDKEDYNLNEFSEKMENPSVPLRFCGIGAHEDGQPIRRKSRSYLKSPLSPEKEMEAIDEVDSEFSDEQQRSPHSDHNGTNTLDTLKRTRSALHSLFRKKPHRTTQQLKAEEAKNARKQVILMLILVIILFMVCWGPRVVYNLIIKACGFAEETCPLYTSFWYKVKVFFSLIPYVHCSINPFIYSFMSKNFKRSMRRQLNRLGTYFGCNWFGCKGPSSDTRALMQLRSQEGNRTFTGHINDSTTTNIV